MCLNGIRCASSYIWGKQLSPIKKMSLQTKHVNLECSPEKSNKVSINIDKPREILDKELHRNLKKVIEEEFFLLNIGNNHLCIKMKSIMSHSMLGSSLISSSLRFKKSLKSPHSTFPTFPSIHLLVSMQVHDELVLEVKSDASDDIKFDLIKIMESSVDLDVPLVVDAAVGLNWDEAH